MDVNDDPQCSVDIKIDCGHVGTTEKDCHDSGCCWQPVAGFLQDGTNVGDTPWCFHKKGEDLCGTLSFEADSPGFTDDFYNQMYQNYMKNINIDSNS